MTRDRLVRLTVTLHNSSRLSIAEAGEFVRWFARSDRQIEAVAFRLVTQARNVEDAKQFGAACASMFGHIQPQRMQ